MRRLLISTVALFCVAGLPGATGPRVAEAARAVDCTDYCGERAAEHCERIDSWNCSWYILGCLAGCQIAQL